jgi:hypothetical protein
MDTSAPLRMITYNASNITLLASDNDAGKQRVTVRDHPNPTAPVGPTVRRIPAIERLRERTRRVLTEFEQHLIPVASAPDPGNPGQVLTLYDPYSSAAAAIGSV